MKLLIDECLSPHLTVMAQEHGFGDSSHVVWRGWSGLKDWQLKPLILAGDWPFVTRNAIDFRGPHNAPGTAGEYADVELHAGLVCLSGPASMDLEMCSDLFALALEELAREPDLINQVLEVTLDDDEILIRRYGLPVDPI
ncbi:MAG: hypothetical protein JSS43_26815 [Proteobacteria bacterium]|nr:hypothetical protein [Pseudomonadota bacterium]